MKRGLLTATALFMTAQAWAVAPTPFHSASWITWIDPDVSAVDQYGATMDGLSVYNYAFNSGDTSGSKVPGLVPEDPPIVNALMSRYAGQNQGGKRPIYLTIVNDVASGSATHEGDINFNAPLIDAILSDPTNNFQKRHQHEADIMALPAINQVDGVEIDYEALLAHTQPYYTSFINELAVLLHAKNKKLSICAQPKLSTAVGDRGGAIDWSGVIGSLDEIQILAYYYSYPGSAPGAVVNSAQLDQLTAFALNTYNLPVAKTHIVFSLFGLDWPVDAQGNAIGLGRYIEYKEAMQIAQSNGITPTRDPSTNVLRINYTDSAGTLHQIWIDDYTSLQPKILQVLNKGIRHVDFWHLGTGDPAIWTWIAANTSNVPDPLDNKTPTILQLKPNTATPGSPATVLDILGGNFENGAAVRWNGADRTPVHFFNATHVQITVPASDLLLPTVSSVTVFNSVVRSTSNIMPFYVVKRPAITTFSPTNAVAGSPGFTMVLTGTGFTAHSIVRWGTSDRVTTFDPLNPTQLKAAILAAEVSQRGLVDITVSNPIEEGGLSQSRTFSVRLTPSIFNLSPGQATKGGPAFTLLVQGNGFAFDSAFVWNGSSIPVQYVSTTTLKVAVSAANIATAGRIPVWVSNPAPGGVSEIRTFIVNASSMNVPVITALNPAAARPNSPAITLTVTGTNFLPGAVVEWQGAALTTQPGTATQLVATIPASKLTTAGKYAITVTNPAPTSGTSAAVLFAVSGSGALIQSVSPTSATQGDPTFPLAITGVGFSTSSVLNWGGSPLPTQYVDNAHLKVTVDAVNISSAGPVQIFVADPFGNSQNYTFPVNPRVPPPPPVVLTIFALNPSSATAGSAATPLQILGQNFSTHTVVDFGGSIRTGTLTTTPASSSTTLTIPLSIADVSHSTRVAVSVYDSTSAPSNTVFFIVTDSTQTSAALTLLTIDPSSRTVGSPAFSMTLTGTAFSTTTVALWNGAALPTHYGSSTTLTADVPADKLASVGTSSITVQTLARVSNGVVFAILPPGTSTGPVQDPSAFTLEPSSAVVGSGAFELVIRGDHFSNQVVVRWNGIDRDTIVVSSVELHVMITAGDLGQVSHVPVILHYRGSNQTLASSIFIVYTDVASGASNLRGARVYPNPWAADTAARAYITFDNLPSGSTIKIFTTSARWVNTLQATADGTAHWNLDTSNGDRAASGYYFYLITDPSGNHTRGRLALVR